MGRTREAPALRKNLPVAILSTFREAVRGTHGDYTAGSVAARSSSSPCRWCSRW